MAPPALDAPDLRALMPGDADAARALLDATLQGTRYLVRAMEMLDAALQFDDPEFLAVIAERREQLVALAMFGTVAGAHRCTKLHALVGHEPRALEALARGVVQVTSDAGERLVICELPDDPLFAAAASALHAAGFREEGRVADYVADNLDLRLLAQRNG